MKTEKINRNALKRFLPVLAFLALLPANLAKADDENKANGHHDPKLAVGAIRLEMTNSMPMITCSREPGRTYYIEATTSLRPPVQWERVCTNDAASGGEFHFMDNCASNYPARFYRVVLEDKQNKGASHGKKLGHDKQS